MQNRRGGLILFVEQKFLFQVQTAAGDRDSAFDVIIVDALKLQGHTNVRLMLVAVDGAKMQVFDFCGVVSFNLYAPKDAAPGQSRTEVRAELVLGLANINTAGIVQMMVAEFTVAVQQSVCMMQSGNEFDI